MERFVFRFLVVCILLGGSFAIVIGVMAHDRGMIQGAIAGIVGGLIAAPFAARMWR